MFPNFTRSALFVFAATGLFGLTLAGTAEAQSVQSQCSTKYQAAKAANTLNGQSWRQFYSACAAELKAGAGTTQQPAAAAPPPAAPPPTATAPVEAPPPAAPKPRKTATAPAAPAADAPVPTGPIVFPTGISPQYSTLTPHMQRLKTCDDQYKANKATNSNGGLKWTQKGGGYYSECNKKLKS
jgi:hypothetical protein